MTEAAIATRIEELLDFLELRSHADVPVRRLSGGFKRRLAVREFGLTVALKITGVTMSLRKRFGLRHRISATASAIGLQRRRRFPR